MATQSAIAGQSFGTGSNIGDGKFSISPLTLAATTTAFCVTVQVTNGAGPIKPAGAKVELRVWYTTTIRTVTGADAPAKLGQTARYVDVVLSEKAGQIIIKDGSLEPVTGTKLHVWVDAPKTETACSLDVDVVELP